MRIGVYPFASTGEIEENLRHIARGIELAASAWVELLAFHECALCGYLPIETKMEYIHPDQVQAGLAAVAQLTQRHRVAVAIGSVRFEGERAFNSMLLFDKEGNVVNNDYFLNAVSSPTCVSKEARDCSCRGKM